MVGGIEDVLGAIRTGAVARTLESQTLEFKTVGRSRDDALVDLAEAAACFANAAGGTIVVGVRDGSGGDEALVGCDLELGAVRHRIFEVTDPGLTVAVREHRDGDTRLIVIDVPEGATLHRVKGIYTERIADTCKQMAAPRIEQVMADRRGDDWSNHSTTVGPEDVDPLALTLARRFLAESVDPQRRAYAEQHDAQLLRTLGLLGPDGHLNRAGVLLLTRSSDSELMTYIHRRTPSGALTANEQFAAPLLIALDRTFDLISARIDRTSLNVGRAVQLQIEDLPQRAVREAVVNAVMHRDYRSTDRIVIEHSATRLAVTSPGPFVTGITSNNVLTAASRTRNPRLAEAIRKLGLAETAGTGVDRMYAAMTGLGHHPPTFEADEAIVRVTLVGGAPNENLARYVSELPSDASDDADAMVTLFTLLARRTVTARAMVDILQKSEAEIQSAFDRLARAPLSMIEPTRQSRTHAFPTYRLQEHVISALGTAVTYRRPTLDSAEQRVLDLLRESGSINARMVRVLLETDASSTSRLLSDLVSRGWLTKTSRSTRGPAVTYGPGPSMPPAPKRTRKGSAER